MGAKHLVSIACLTVVAVAASAGLRYRLFVYPNAEPLAAQSVPVASAYDVPNATLATSSAGGANTYRVTIPHTAALSDGAFLLQLTVGNPSNGSVQCVVYAVYGPKAKLGGSYPMQGTDAAVLDPQGNYLASASASIVDDKLVLTVNQGDFGGGSVILSRVFGTDATQPGQDGSTPVWESLPSKFLSDDLPSGNFIMPMPTGADAPAPASVAANSFRTDDEFEREDRFPIQDVETGNLVVVNVVPYANGTQTTVHNGPAHWL